MGLKLETMNTAGQLKSDLPKSEADESASGHGGNADDQGCDKGAPQLALVIPCYNEQDVLPITLPVLDTKLSDLEKRGFITENSYILLVDDGSHDSTWSIVESSHSRYPARVHGLKFSHNRGHQNALYAGLMEALNRGCDAAISMDADLQDDPDAIDAMVKEYAKGNDIVYGVRDNRDTDTVFKRSTADLFYKMMSWLGTDTIPNHADYRLMSRTALEALSHYTEVNLFLRGIVPSLGFPHSRVYYKRGSRAAGESKYPLKKMMSFAVEGITSFSITPLRAITGIGLISVAVGIVILIYVLVSFFCGRAVAGWGSVMCSIWILGGLILSGIGVVGEYVGRIYLEVKHRPRYIVEERI